jgi:hypothetical protein
MLWGVCLGLLVCVSEGVVVGNCGEGRVGMN